MPDIIRTTAVWTGAPGLPGYSQFYTEVTGVIATQAQAAHDAVQTFLGGLENLLPEEVTITVDPLYQVLNAATGDLVGEGTVGTPAGATVGTYVGGWNAQVGVLVQWITDAIVNHRHLRGRTYLVPLGDVSQADGTVPEATLSGIRTWAGAISVGNPAFVVWHRPVSRAGGQVSTITGQTVRDRVCMMRSRMI